MNDKVALAVFINDDIFMSDEMSVYIWPLLCEFLVTLSHQPGN